MKSLPITFGLAVLIFSRANATFAAVGTDLSYGAKASALGGMTAALPRDGFSAFQNPAQLSGPASASRDARDPRVGYGFSDAIGSSESASTFRPATGAPARPPMGTSPRSAPPPLAPPALLAAPAFPERSNLEFSWGFIFMKPQLQEINGPVVIQNTTTGDTVRTGSVDTDYPSVIGQAIGMNYRNARGDWKPAFGLVVYLPLDRFAYLDSGEPFAPDYVRYRSRMQKPEFHLALGVEPTREWRIGAGAQIGAGLNSTVDVFLQTDAAKSSSMRVSASLKTKASPYFGTSLEVTPNWTSGLVARMALSNPERINVRASGRVIGDLSAIDANFESLATAYYEPLTVEWGNRVRVSEGAVLHFQLEYQAWSQYESPNLDIDTAGTSNCAPNCGGLQFSPSRYPSFTTRDLIVPKLGIELGDLRLGYSYVGSIFSDPPSSTGHNLLDPAHHRLSAGYGFEGADFLSTQLPWGLEFAVSYTLLQSSTVARSGDAIGAPGYSVGGDLFGAGVSLNLSL